MTDRPASQIEERPPPPQGPPYAPTTAALGGVPSVGVDVPVTAVFMVFFLVGAITHMTILQLNLRKKHKFILSGLMFGFCMARLMTCVLRIAWAVHPNHIPLAIAANIFVSAGVVLLFIVNIIFAERILRATHQHLGWNKALSRTLIGVFTLIVITLIMVIVATVQSFYTLSTNTKRIDRAIQLYGGTLFMVVSFLPILIVLTALLLPRTTPVEHFGRGHFKTKIAVLLVGALLLLLGTCFRTATNFRPPRPRSDPAWYHSKACFYIFNLLIETIVIYLYAISRVDLRFYVPNGASKPGDYSAGGQRPVVVHTDPLADDEDVVEPVASDGEKVELGKG